MLLPNKLLRIYLEEVTENKSDEDFIFPPDEETVEIFSAKQLHPKIWPDGVNGTINEPLRRRLLKIVENFLTKMPFPIQVEDIILTGSLTGYHYTKYSDFDVHILVDFQKIKDIKNRNTIKTLFDNIRYKWNLEHDITFYGFEVELYIQGVDEEHFTNGLYSLMKNKWIEKPVKDKITADDKEVQRKVKKYTKKIKWLKWKLEDPKLSQETAEQIYYYAKKLKEKIHGQRSEAIKREGMLGTYNLVFKILRNNGTIKELLDIISQAYDLVFELSL